MATEMPCSRPDDGSRLAILRQISLAPLLSLAIMGLVCLGLLATLGQQAARLRQVAGPDLGVMDACRRLDHDLALQQAGLQAAIDGSPEAWTAGVQGVAAGIERASQRFADDLSDPDEDPAIDPATAAVVIDLARATSALKAQTASPVTARDSLRRLQTVRDAAQGRMDRLTDTLRADTTAAAEAGDRAARYATAGVILALLACGVTAAVSLLTLRRTLATVARTARHMALADHAADHRTPGPVGGIRPPAPGSWSESRGRGPGGGRTAHARADQGQSPAARP